MVLSPLSLKVIDTKRLQGSRPLDEWLPVLRELAEFDAHGDNLRAYYGKRTLQWGIGAFILFIVAFVALSNFPLPLAATALILPIGVLGVCIHYWRKKRKIAHLDLSNDFREVLLPFLETISEDIRATHGLALKLDLSGFTDKKKIKDEKIPPGRFISLREKIHIDPWCWLEAPLENGHRLVLELTSQLIAHTRTYRSISGKIKSKTKSKKLIVATTTLRPNPDSLAPGEGAAGLPYQGGKVKVREKKGGPSISLTRKFKFKGAGSSVEATFDPDQLVGMLLEVCRRLAPAGARS